MIPALCLALSLGGASGYVDASLEFEGELLDFRFVDVDRDGRSELVVALLQPDGRRRLQVHVQNDRGFEVKSAHEVDVLEDVIAFGFGDVREEAGCELLLLTRSGAYSYSLQKNGYRGNIARLVDAPLLYDVPSPRALPYWPYVLEAAGGDRLLLPEREGFAVYGPSSQPAADPQQASYVRVTDFGAGGFTPAAGDEAGPATRDRRDDEGQGDGRQKIRIALGAATSSPLLGELDAGDSLLTDSKSYRAPALADVDGDGTKDLVMLTDDELQVYLSRGGSFRGEPDRREAFPDYLKTEGESESLVLRLEDLDGDGDPDILGTVEKEGDGFEDSDLRLLLLINDGKRLLPEVPNQVLRIEAAVMRVEVLDANHDGRPDLSLRKFNLPSLVETVTGLEFTMTYLLFLGEDARDRVVARKPAMKQSETFDENSVAEVLKYRVFELDCDGDELPDVVEVDLQGRIAIRRMTFDSGFFSGDTWELERDPWRRFDVRGDIQQLEVLDLNGDGLGDVVSRGPSGLTLLMSRRGR
ncbi:MAG: VCBS repeat-containing protein [Planctomycetes bacterium]|nr:VCBS repeat-containing protein [Planctomycetota bacterium]